MPSLLSLNLPSLTNTAIAFFSRLGIVSVEDFLVYDTYNLVALAGQQLDADQYKQAVADILLCLEEEYAVWLDGTDLLNMMQHTVSLLPTGCKSFDDILSGGLRDGSVTELVGPSSSGKTQICIQTAASAALQGTVVFYIDTCNSFSPSRLADISCNLLDLKRKEHFMQTQKNLEEALKRVVCYRVHDVFSLLALLHQIDANLTAGIEGHEGVDGLRSARLIVLDSVSSVVASVLSNSHVQGHALMMKCGQTLRKIASENNLCVLVTNHTVAGENGVLKPALGESWKVVANVRLLISREPSTDIVCVSLVKHSSMQCNKQAYFQLSSAVQLMLSTMIGKT